MCSVSPVEVVSLLDGNRAVVIIEGKERVISTALLLEGVAVGDYVTVFLGYARERYAPEATREILAFLGQFQCEGYGRQAMSRALPA